MILVSVGHHPHAKGVSFGEFNEFDEAQRWASSLCNMLGSLALQVPVGVLKKKVKFINDYCHAHTGDHLALEIHFNSAVDGNGNHIGEGSESLYYPTSNHGRHIAEAIQQNLSRVFEPNRGAKEGWYRMDRSRGPDYFLARTTCPAIIIEPDFIHRVEVINEKRSLGCAAIAQVLIELYGER